MYQRNNVMIKRNERLDLDQVEENNSSKNATFVSFFPPLYLSFLLETGASEKLSLKVPSNVVEGSARATYSVLGESPAPGKWLAVSIIPVHAASPSMANEGIDFGHWIERKVLS